MKEHVGSCFGASRGKDRPKCRPHVWQLRKVSMSAVRDLREKAMLAASVGKAVSQAAKDVREQASKDATAAAAGEVGSDGRRADS